MNLIDLRRELRLFKHRLDGRKVYTWVIRNEKGKTIRVARMPYVEEITFRRFPNQARLTLVDENLPRATLAYTLTTTTVERL